MTLRHVGKLLLRLAVISIPFALFFSFLFGQGTRTLGGYYLVSLFLGGGVMVALELNRLLVLPRLNPRGRAEGGAALALEIASFGVAAMVGVVAAGALMNVTFAKGAFSSARAVGIFIGFSVIFSMLFLALIYAVRFQRRFAERVRAEAKQEQELQIAGEIQRALLPAAPRVTRSFTAAGSAVACRTIGGDFFDYFDLPEGRLGIALGDVAGKGPPAALLAAMVQGIFTSHVDDGHGPAGTIERVNRVLAPRIIEGRFATIFYSILSPSGELVSCNAGNNPPIVIRVDGTVHRLEKGGLPMGPFPEATYEEESTRLQPGDTLVLYSDGVSDASAPDDESYGEERLIGCLSRGMGLAPEQLVDHVLQDVRAFSADRPQFDDITLLVVRFEGAA